MASQEFAVREARMRSRHPGSRSRCVTDALTTATGAHVRKSDHIALASEPDVAGLRVCIHRGAREIGGNCVELESSGKRLLIDIGRPLDASLNSRIEVPGITDAAPGALLGVVISHPHQD